MQIQSEKGYDYPKIASFYEVNISNSTPFDVMIGDEGAISIKLGTDPYEVNLPELLVKIPVLKKKNNWILEKRWACVFFPEWDTPLFFNKMAKEFCLLCNGKNTIEEILENRVKANLKYDRKTVVNDAIRFIFLLKKLKLISIRGGN